MGRKVPGEGPTKNTEILFVGEGPGIAEEMAGRPFVGKTGKEMYRLCKQAGIDFSKCRRTNVVLYRPLARTATGNNPPSKEEIKRDEPELIEEIRKVRPRFIAAVGRVASRWFLGDVDMEDCHALAFPVRFCLQCGRRFREPQTTIDTASNGENPATQERVLAVDSGGEGGERRISIRGVLVERKERSSASGGLRNSNQREDPGGVGFRSPMQSTTVRKSKTLKGMRTTNERSSRTGADSKERKKNSLQVGASAQQKEHVRPQGEKTRTALQEVRTTKFNCESCSSETIRVIVVPVIHPAAGLHSPETQPVVYYDFMQLGKYVSGKLDPNPPINQFPDPDYYEPRGSVVLAGSRKTSIDTEGLRGRVWGLSYTQIAGSAGVIRATNKKALKSFKEQLIQV